MTNVSTVVSGATNNFTVNGVPDGLHNWSISCIDKTDAIGNASTWMLYVDTSAPNVTLNIPVVKIFLIQAESD